MLKQYKIRNYHFELIISIMALNIIGILLIGSAKPSVQKTQIFGFAVGIVIMVAISLMDYSFILRFSWVYYVGIVGLLVMVMIPGIGDDAGGAQRWIKLPGFRFQPSELAKIVIILFFAWYFAKFHEKLNTIRVMGISFVLVGVPLVLILKQPDTSTTIAIALIFISLLFIAGLSYKIIITVLGICIPAGIVGITVILRQAQSSSDYRFGRIMAWLYPSDPRWSDTAAQQQNSIMAIGSGQLWGKGLNNSVATSMKNANYIIEPQTDFIFAVAGEELGFVGTLIIILLLLFIILECILIARKAKDLSGRLICCGMAALVGFQSVFNIFVATGLMPNTGIPLPFVSYGLTSLLSLYIGMGFVLNVGLQPRKY
jgi:rod shape determining protein RodA